MTYHARSIDPRRSRWLRHGAARLRRALSSLQRVLGLDHQPQALALIPIRAERLHPSSRPHRYTLPD